jgi:hypothetical protein
MFLKKKRESQIKLEIPVIMAERQGFEPWVRAAHTRFPGVPLKPLGHLSVKAKGKKIKKSK